MIVKKLMAYFIGAKSKKTIMCSIGLFVSAVLYANGIITEQVFVYLAAFFAAGIPASLWAKMDKTVKAIATMDMGDKK